MQTLLTGGLAGDEQVNSKKRTRQEREDDAEEDVGTKEKEPSTSSS